MAKQGKIIRNGITYSGGGSGCDIMYLTQAQYDALPESKLTNGVEYRITDSNPPAPTAKDMAYDNSESGLEAETVQDAIDGVNNNLESLFIIRKTSNLSMTVPASGSARLSTGISVPAPDGYTLVGYSTLSHNSNLILGTQLSSNIFYIVARNNSSSEVKDAKVTLSAMYIKNDLSIFE